MKKILILYFSGVGATKKIAELMHSSLSQKCKVDIFSIENKDIPSADNYDALIIGTPVYHCTPAKLIMDYLGAMSVLNKKTPAFIYNTRTLYALNTNRILAQQLRGKNICVVMDKSYRSPASDGTLLVPYIKRFFKFAKDIESRIALDCMIFLKMLHYGKSQCYIPKFRMGSILNAPNKAIGHLSTVKIHLHNNKCVKCYRCIEECPHRAFSKDKSNYPILDSKKCENCYRCIHHCPKSALSLSKHRTPKKLLRY